MKSYTLIGGVNGAGKSSLTGSLRAEHTDSGTIIDPNRLTARNGCGSCCNPCNFLPC